jgi:hypothetical protein
MLCSLTAKVHNDRDEGKGKSSGVDLHAAFYFQSSCKDRIVRKRVTALFKEPLTNKKNTSTRRASRKRA